MDDLRSDFLIDPAITFLNHGSFGATPRPVFECYQHWQLELERQPVEFLGRRATALLRQSRITLGEYLHTDADNLVYVTNATGGINIVARSLRLGPGDEVLGTDHEYGAMDRTWRFLSRKSGFNYQTHHVRLPILSESDFVDDFWSSVSPRTRVIFISHITSPTAIIFPVQEICRRARQAGILTVVDGAHAPGQIDLDLDRIGADFYSGNLHKWLCAPKGAGFLFATPQAQPLLEPLVVSWGWESDHPSTSRFIDEQEWTGTRDIAAFLTIPEAIRYQKHHDWAAIRQTCHTLVTQTQSSILTLTGRPPLHPDSPAWYYQMGAAELPAGIDGPVLQSRLYDEYRIEIPVISWRDRLLIRFSFQAYNSPADMEKLIAALRILL